MMSPASSLSPALDNDRYLRLAELAQYSSLSERTLRRALADPVHPLPAHRLGRVVLVRRRDFDAWLETREDSAARLGAEAASGTMSEARRIAMEVAGYPVSDVHRRRRSR